MLDPRKTQTKYEQLPRIDHKLLAMSMFADRHKNNQNDRPKTIYPKSYNRGWWWGIKLHTCKQALQMGIFLLYEKKMRIIINCKLSL